MLDSIANSLDSSGFTRWGTALPAILAAWKLENLLRNRLHIKVTCHAAQTSEAGTQILIHNLSHRPVDLHYWEIFHWAGYWPFSRESEIYHAEPQGGVLIGPYSTYKLTFATRHLFPASKIGQANQALGIRLYFRGCRPVRRKIRQA